MLLKYHDIADFRHLSKYQQYNCSSLKLVYVPRNTKTKQQIAIAHLYICLQEYGPIIESRGIENGKHKGQVISNCILFRPSFL